jgi:ATP-dependent RNA helicase DDX24/MAK5
LKRSLLASNFAKPSPIQEVALSTVLTADAYSVSNRDLIGVAETGSGKTLAYSLPILQEVMRQEATFDGRKRSLAALILCPTRELALQVRQHVGDIIYKASIPSSQDGSSEKVKYTPRVNIITICGGMSVQKQKRLLNTSYGVDIIVATPGRLWDMIEEDENLGKQIKGARFLVLDEADRMIENGHFAELESIVALTRRKAKKGKGKQGDKGKGPAIEAAFEDDFENPESSLDAFPVREDMRTYVFSATMSKELQRNVKRLSKNAKTTYTTEEQGHMGALGDLLAKLDFRDEDPKVIDLTTAGGVVKSLQEVKIDCLLAEKDAYLYYFLLRYPGRTLVFLSSIDAIRRLQPLLQMLELNVAVLHSGMQQRARLKALDRCALVSIRLCRTYTFLTDSRQPSPWCFWLPT